MDIYSTDAKIERYKLRVLETTGNTFRATRPCSFTGSRCRSVFPKPWRALEKLEGRIDERRMIA